MAVQELKKLGLKINSLSRKIEEANKSGMITRVPGYIEELEKQQKRYDKLLSDLKIEFPNEF